MSTGDCSSEVMVKNLTGGNFVLATEVLEMTHGCAESALGGCGHPPRLGGDVAGVATFRWVIKTTFPHKERWRSLLGRLWRSSPHA